MVEPTCPFETVAVTVCLPSLPERMPRGMRPVQLNDPLEPTIVPHSTVVARALPLSPLR